MILTKDGDLIFPLPGDGAAAAAFIVLKKAGRVPQVPPRGRLRREPRRQDPLLELR